eukprot:CAMPEP_0201514100 /NCGR_PEP_ID=MMETSP0161_2-20130828/6007_1 /ASSEMBLY_ACC=CAM_ASM_000251 /TAXON_ID=180227 /ORGANISM="Neoparamoeba aestuarina, Strain SoJaBio B1-5/56/2" /LENGTH=240 /DNA_ID=CAMNT_0047910553 /DNA_START=61 /DNA_END=783 /DNA_ORIENTATION=+
MVEDVEMEGQQEEEQQESVWESKDILNQEAIEVSQEEYQAQMEAAQQQQQQQQQQQNEEDEEEEEEGGGFEEQNVVLRLPAQAQPTIPQLLEKLELSVNPNQCLEISAANFESFNATAQVLCTAFNSSDWTRDDLDEHTAARLFEPFPLIVIKDIDARAEVALEPFLHLFYTSAKLQEQEMMDKMEEFMEQNPGFSGEMDMASFLPCLPSFLVLSGTTREAFSYSFGNGDEGMMVIPEIV